MPSIIRIVIILNKEWEVIYLADKIDWSQAKTEYVTGQISLLEMSKKYDISYNSLNKRAKDDKWREARAQYREKTIKKAVRKASNKESSKLADLMTSTDRLLNKITRTLEDDKQFNRQLVKRVSRSGDGGSEEWVEERIYKKIDTRAVNDLTRALKDLSQLQRELYNIPTAAEAEAQRIAAERLKLEQAKADSNKPDSEIIVRFADDSTEEYSD